MSPSPCRRSLSFLLCLPLVLLLGASCGSSGAQKGGACTINGDCASGLTCVSHKCEPPSTASACTRSCTADTDCPSNTCVSNCCAPSCITDSDCNNGQSCVNNACLDGSSSTDGGTDTGMDAGTTMMTGCTQDADCASNAATPLCDPNTGNCVGCRSNADCDPVSVCTNNTCQLKPGACRDTTDCASPTPACVDHACVQCQTNADCPANNTCSKADYTCHPTTPTGCQTDANCTTPGLTKCDVSSGQCFACLTNADCGAGMACQNHACMSGQSGCHVDTDCTMAGLNKCDSGSGTCFQCLADGDCAAGQLCQSHVCQQKPCTQDADCASSTSGHYCRMDTGACVTCTTDAQCGSGMSCVANACQAGPAGCSSDADCTSTASTPHCETMSRTCVACTADSQCPSGQACVANQCQATAMCKTDADCTSSATTPYCNTGTGHCVACATDAQCSSGQLCIGNACKAVVSCMHDADCSANSGACTALSNSTNTGFNNVCVAPGNGFALGGEACASDADCISGYCFMYAANTSDGICLDACTSNSDCGSNNCPTTGVVFYLPGPNGMYDSTTPNDDTWASARVCWPKTCKKDSDCWYEAADFSDRSCRPEPTDPTDPNNDSKIAMYCMPAFGSGLGGDTCTQNTDCASGLCLTWQDSSGNQHNGCFGACTRNSDCIGGNGYCGNTSFTSNGTTIKSCEPN